MPIRVARAFARIHWPQAAVLIAFMASVVAALAFTPQTLIEKALEADWRAIGAVITGILTALGGIVGSSLLKPSDRESDPPPRARWDEPGYHDEDPTPAMSPRALDRRDRAPGDSTRPRSKRDGSTGPGPALAMVLGSFAIAIAIGLLSGCVSAVRVHATVASTTGATIDTWCQEEVERREREQQAAVDAHEYREDAAAAVAEVRARYEPTIGGCGAAKGLHDGWVGVIALGAAGAPFDPIDAARRFAAPIVETWEGIARASAGGDHPLPAPPPELMTIADAIAPREEEAR